MPDTPQLTTDPLSKPARLALRTGIPLGLVAAGALSFESQIRLAESIGWHGKLAWLLPAAVDVYATVATVVWSGTNPEHAELKHHSFRNAMGGTVLSLALNALWHAISFGAIPVSLPVVLAVGAVPPVAVALLLHLAMSVPAEVPVPVPAEVSSPTEVPVPAAEPLTTPVPVPEPQVPLGRGVKIPEASPVPGSGEVPVPVQSAATGEAMPTVEKLPVPVPLVKVRTEKASVATASARRAAGTGIRKPSPEAITQVLAVLAEADSAGRDPGTVRAPELVARYGKTDSWWRYVLRHVRAELGEQVAA